MHKSELNKACEEINNFKNKFGETIFDAIMDDHNFTYDIADMVLETFYDCKTDRGFDIANSILLAISGHNLSMIVERIKKRDKEDFVWESC